MHSSQPFWAIECLNVRTRKAQSSLQVLSIACLRANKKHKITGTDGGQLEFSICIPQWRKLALGPLRPIGMPYLQNFLARSWPSRMFRYQIFENALRSMLLQNKIAIIYGAGGSLGGAVAKSFAGAGARVFLTGLHLSSVQKVCSDILASGGKAEFAQVDALDEIEINDHISSVVQSAGKVDISFNAAGVDLVQNIPLIDIPLDDFLSPISMTMQTRFLTAKAAAKVMIKQKSGVILTLTATPGGIGYPFTGGFAPACCAVESLSRNLASELGIYGIRVVNIRSGGSPDSRVFKEAIAIDPRGMETTLGTMRADTMLKELPLMADIANTAVFLVSDLASKITGVTIDVTCGTTAGLNYRVAPEAANS
jgi:3-oxoacyl-[acyl-carrier protein] reductase